MNLYTIVTNDAYELPVLCDVRAKEAAEFLKTTTNGVRKMICKPPKKTKYKPVITGRVRHDSRKYYRNYSQAHDRSEYFRKYYQAKKLNNQKKREEKSSEGSNT